MNLPPTRIRINHIAERIGPKIPLATISTIIKKKATIVSFHSNQITTLEIAVKANGRSKVNDAADIILNENCLDHVIELDLSSNKLQEGCELCQYRSPTRFSLLSMTFRLVKLNLSSNQLNERSLSSLICVTKPNGSYVPLLPCLKHLDISNNSFLVLPENLAELCPALNHVAAMNNKIKSLTSLLQTLYKFRDRLESVHLFNRSTRRNNPVCERECYRDKVIFILGRKLKQLDGIKITGGERESVRLKLSGQYDIETSREEQDCHAAAIEHCTPTQQYSDSDSFESSCDTRFHQAIGNAPQHHNIQQHHRNHLEDRKDIQISELEHQVASLSALVEKQTHLTSNLIQASKDQHNNCTEQVKEMLSIDDNVKEPKEEITQKDAAGVDHSMMKRKQLAIAGAALKMFVIAYRQNRTNLTLAFSRWRLLVGVSAYSTRITSMLSCEKKKWATTTNELRKDAEKIKQRMSLAVKAEKVAHNKASELTSTISELEKKLQAEQMKYQQSHQEATNTTTSLQETVRTLYVTINENATRIRQLESDLEASTKELCYALPQASIKQLKNTFEQVATKAAADRAKAEQSKLEERQAKDLLQKHIRKMSEMEDQIESLESIKEHLQSTVDSQRTRSNHIQRETQTKSAHVASLQAEVEKLKSIMKNKVDFIVGLERKMKASAEELKECHIVNSRLQSQLDRCKDEICVTKDSQKELLDAEKLKVDELRQQCQEAKRVESELRLSIKRIEQESNQVRESSLANEKMTRSLQNKLRKVMEDKAKRESQLLSKHKLEMKEVTVNVKQEAISLKNALEKERKYTAN
eukprot:scaffold15101_cov28-Cyclotella_meneghiniana.AAC.2